MQQLDGTHAYASAIYLYTYACHEDEEQLCRLEQRALFGSEQQDAIASEAASRRNYVLSTVNLDASRSPFFKQKLSVSASGSSIQAIAAQIHEQRLQSDCFKVVYVVTTGEADAADYNSQRAAEREIGAAIRGKADMRRPERLFGIACVEGQWLFGACHTNKAIWLKHNTKPQHYSTALGTRMARAVANITVPHPEGVEAIDPCCGIGTVLIEALSMGINMTGSDLNPLAVRGARQNLLHFALPDVVTIQDMRTITGAYDAAVLDMPYNLCSVLAAGERFAMLVRLRVFAKRAVIIATESMEVQIEQAGFRIADRCVVKKGRFCRYVWVCL